MYEHTCIFINVHREKYATHWEGGLIDCLVCGIILVSEFTNCTPVAWVMYRRYTV